MRLLTGVRQKTSLVQLISTNAEKIELSSSFDHIHSFFIPFPFQKNYNLKNNCDKVFPLIQILPYPPQKKKIINEHKKFFAVMINKQFNFKYKIVRNKLSKLLCV